MTNFVSVEHAEAVAALFHHMGPRYWYEHPDGRGHLQNFLHAFSYVMQRLEGKMSLLNEPRSYDHLSTLMHTVVERTIEVDKQMVQAQLQMCLQTTTPGTWIPRGADSFCTTQAPID